MARSLHHPGNEPALRHTRRGGASAQIVMHSGNRGAQRVAEMLEQNVSLHTLDVTQNVWPPAATLHLESQASLRALHVARCRLDDGGLECLSHVLPTMPGVGPLLPEPCGACLDRIYPGLHAECVYLACV